MSISIENEVAHDFPETILRESVDAALQHLGFTAAYEVSVTVTNDENIQELNREYRGIDRATDVLSFPLNNPEDLEDGTLELNPDTGEALLGDIVLSMDACHRQAEEYGHSLEREVAYLTVHSVLHLMGYDHIEDEDKQVMRAKEEEIMNKLGLTR